VQVADGSLVFVGDHVGGHGAVVVEQVLLAGGRAKRTEDGGQVVHAVDVVHTVGAQTIGVVQTVLVGVILGEGAQHFGQLVDGGRHLQTQVIQPVLTDSGGQHGGVHGTGRDAVDRAVHLHAVPAHFALVAGVHIVHQIRVLIHQTGQVGEQAFVGVLHIGAVLHQDQVGDIAGGDGQRQLLGEVFRHADQLQVDVQGLEDVVVDLVRVGVLGAAVFPHGGDDHGFLGAFRHCRRQQGKKHHGSQQDCQDLFHGSFLLLFFICLAFCQRNESLSLSGNRPSRP